jgi:hypothetical protein
MVDVVCYSSTCVSSRAVLVGRNDPSSLFSHPISLTCPDFNKEKVHKVTAGRRQHPQPSLSSHDHWMRRSTMTKNSLRTSLSMVYGIGGKQN